jgi:hypothetical protein|tara:strand:- start:1862 stop:3007 length:1146 start_codon:yes stop_codon:yes gene_type:complete
MKLLQTKTSTPHLELRNRVMKTIRDKNISIIFDVRELYYLPQYLPIYYEFLKRNKGNAIFVFHHGKFDSVAKEIVKKEKLNDMWIANDSEARDFYVKEKPEWIFFGNSFPFFKDLHNFSKTAQLGHGVGPKSSYYSISLKPTTVRFVEGQVRKNRLEKMFPNDTFIDSGYSKLDPIINNEVKKINLEAVGLDKKKKTILFCPTFYPSCLENFPENFPTHFKEFNIIIKPHFFTFFKSKYKNQRSLLSGWKKYSNTYLSKPSDISLIPFIATADLMISDTSSAILEFSAFNKPVFICKFLKLRWNYRGLFSYRLKKRMDTDYNFYSKFSFFSESYFDLIDSINNLDLDTFSYKKFENDFIEQMIGSLDGNASKRIVDYIEIN